MALGCSILYCVFQVTVVFGRGGASLDGFARVPQYTGPYGSPCLVLRTALLFTYSVIRSKKSPLGRYPSADA